MRLFKKMQLITFHLITSSLIVFVFGVFFTTPSIAQNFPEKPITIIVPMGAGGASDVLIRAISPYLSNQLKQPIIIDNRPGANGLIGEELFTRATPDGYTLMLGSSSATTNLWLHKLNYDPRKLFIPIIKIASVPMAFVINPSKVQSNNVKEFINFANNTPSPLNYGSWGDGSVSHITMELFKLSTKVKISHIPYKTSPQALNDLLGGQVDVMFIGLPAALQQVASNKLKILAITSATRSPTAPDIPTMIENGYPKLEFESWFGIFALQGTPSTVTSQVYLAIQKVLNQEEVKEKLQSGGYRVSVENNEDFVNYFLKEIKNNEMIIKGNSQK